MANYKNLNEYKTQIKKNGTVATFQEGYFYSYDYDFIKDPKNSQLQYYDKMPLSLVYSIKGDDFWGFNLHHFPVAFREDILVYLFGKDWWRKSNKRSIFKSIKDKKKRMFTSKGKPIASEFKKITTDYKTLMDALSDVSFIVRRYKISRKSNHIRINQDFMPELIKYTADTYHSSGYDKAMRNFYLKRSKVIEKELKK